MKWKLEIVILLGIMAIIGISIYGISTSYTWSLIAGACLTFIWPPALGLLVFVTLGVSWEHPKWYVKLYTVVCFLWLVFHFFYRLENPCHTWVHPVDSVSWIVQELSILFCDVAPNALPLVPLWYLAYKGHKLKKEE